MDRVIKTIVLVVLLAASVSADILDSTAQYFRVAKMNLGVDSSSTSYISNNELNAWLDESAMTICMALGVIRADKTVTTTAYQTTYNFSSFDSLAVNVKGVLFVGRDTVKALTYTPREKWPSPPVTNMDGRAAPARWPSMYDFSKTQLFVYPPPIRTGDTIKADMILKPPTLASNATLTTVPTAYRHVILTYTTWLAATAKQHPMVNLIFSRLQMELSALGWKVDASGTLVPTTGK